MVASTPGPFYMRLARPSSEVIYADQSMSFEVGRGNILEDGSDATIIGCGLMVKERTEGWQKKVKKKGISCRVVDMFSIKPIDKDLNQPDAQRRQVPSLQPRSTMSLVVLEGVCLKLLPRKRCTHQVCWGHDIFGESARDEEIDMLLEHEGPTATEISKAVLEARNRSRK